MTGLAKSCRTSAALPAVVIAALVAAPASVAASGSGRLTATALVPTSTITAAKSGSGRLAQSDTSLVSRSDSADRKSVV